MPRQAKTPVALPTATTKWGAPSAPSNAHQTAMPTEMAGIQRSSAA